MIEQTRTGLTAKFRLGAGLLPWRGKKKLRQTSDKNVNSVRIEFMRERGKVMITTICGLSLESDSYLCITEHLKTNIKCEKRRRP